MLPFLVVAVVVGAPAAALGAAPAGRSATAAAGVAATATECGTANLLARKAPSQQSHVVGDPALVTDEEAVPEGALWDGPFAVKLEGPTGSLTYDLGRPQAVSAFYLQADANDAYRITGSLDGSEGSFKLLVVAPNAIERGHGMRVRTPEIPPVTVRYLRVGEGEGDGAYSISELAAYCRAPQPFPPVLRTTEAPMAVEPTRPVEHPVVSLGEKVEEPFGIFEIALAALLAMLGVSKLLARSARTRATARNELSATGQGTDQGADAEGDGDGDGDGAEEEASESAVGSPPEVAADPSTAVTPRAAEVAPPERTFPLLLLLFLASGAAALVYEIVWFQHLQLVLGSSAVSIAVLLGTFMAGMCLGSLALGRYVSRRRHPLRVYALLEVVIAGFGLLLLVAMPVVQSGYTAVVGHGVPGFVLRGLFAALCLLVPTAMMGATLPAVARWVETTPRGVSWLGYFYGANTIGAVVGCLVAGFYLLRVHDMPTATYVAVGLNLIAATAAFAIARARPYQGPSPAATPATAETAAPTPAPPPGIWAVYVTIGLSGMTALGAEVIWTRLLTLLLGGTTYSFSIILAVFLIGIGLGSAVGSGFARKTANPRRALGVVQLLLVGAISWSVWNITSALPYWPVDPNISPTTWYQFQIDFVRCLWSILPAACLWGASFPLALASVASDGQDGGRMVGRVYAANTVGAIVGALAAGAVVSSWLGSQDSQRLLIALVAVSALTALAPVFSAASQRPRFTTTSAFVVLVVVEIASIAAHNVAPVPALLVGHGRSSAASYRALEKYLYVGEGMNSTLAVSRDANGILSYHNAGKVQASTQPQDMRLQRMLGHLTTLIPENPKSVLVIACGAGVTAGAASIDPRVERLTIAEIEALVPKAASKYFGDYNHDVVKNPKVRVHIDDARHFLNTTKEKFDAITSDPFDPWVKGAATLYTKEFWQMAKQHLNPGGVVTVFVQLYQAGNAAVKSEIATFFEVFPNGIVWGNTVRGEGYDIVLSGRLDDVPINVDEMERRLASPEYAPVAKSLRKIGFNSAVGLLSTFGGRAPDLKPWTKDAEINRDRNLRLQFLAGFDMNTNDRVEVYRNILAFRRYPEDLFIGQPETLTALRTAMLARPQ
jgi:spermidine synthase